MFLAVSLLAARGALPQPDAWGTTIRIHPENPKYFLFRGQPLVLLSISEHYGSVINRRFDFDRYLEEAADKKMTMTRTFLLFRELQNPRNPYSPCKPESPDFVAPWPRTGPGKALDGEPIYDLDQWNPEYFDRLHRFLDHASKRGIVVELTLFSNTYSDTLWALNPLNATNNLQHIGKIDWPDYTSTRNKILFERQIAYVRKIVQETARYDNVYYEICNEPGGGKEGHATPYDVNHWQAEISRVVRAECEKAHHKHLVFGLQCYSYLPGYRFPQDAIFDSDWADVVNVHSYPDTFLRGQKYYLGGFEDKDLHLKIWQAFAHACYSLPKPMVQDEDNSAPMYLNETGWTILRKRAWTAVLNGSHYDTIDFSIIIGSETGIPESRAAIRTWMKHLVEFTRSFDFVHAKLSPDWVTGLASTVVCSGMAIEGKDYVAYLADAREVTDLEAGKPILAKATLKLPLGTYDLTAYSPISGKTKRLRRLRGGQPEIIELAPFRQDLVLRARAR